MKYPLRYLGAIVLLFGLYVLVVVLPQQKAYEAEMKQKNKDFYESRYVDPKEWVEGRVCDKLFWKCLPESQEKGWQGVPTSDNIEDLELTAEVKKKYDLAIKAWNKTYHDYRKKHPNIKGDTPVLITSLDKDFFEKVDARQFLEEMEESLEKEFPGFWKDVKKKVRYRWIRRAMNKAKKFGYKSKKPVPMIELCARIGLDFDKDPKWQYIVKFITNDHKNIGSNMGSTCDYIDWTIFDKAYSLGGYKITDWAMRDVNGWLPTPKNPYPKLND